MALIELFSIAVAERWRRQVCTERGNNVQRNRRAMPNPRTWETPMRLSDRH
jgi:hypothetical protein